MSDIPVIELAVRGRPVAMLAQELRRIAEAIERGELVEESGGLMLVPDGDGFIIRSDLKLCIGPKGKQTH